MLGQEAAKPICIGEKLAIKSEILNQDREIFVALPENYYDTEGCYSVHYVLDGDVTFRIYSSLVSLKSGSAEIPESIVVGIPNIDRNFDLDHRANGINFLDFITKELIPLIDNKYRTNKNRLMMGYSMSGSFTVYSFLNDAESFDMFLSGAPYRLDLFGEDDITKLLENAKAKKSIYTSMGSRDRPKQLEFFRTFCESFENEEEDLVDFKYEIVPDRDHENSYLLNWQDGLDYLYRDWKLKKQ
jgi:predicted alpha/beta superfamily hydrolase